MYVYHIYILYIGISNLRSSITTNTTITIVWDPAVSPSNCGPVFYYNVSIVNLCNAPAISTIVTYQTTTLFSNLRNGNSYTISVAAVNRAGSGPSSMITVTTLTGSEGGKQYKYVHNWLLCVYAHSAIIYIPNYQ